MKGDIDTNTLFLDYYRFSGSYANLKWEQGSRRPMFYCDIPSLDPTLLIMQYKVYPKFHDSGRHIMLRHEMIPTKFAKLFTTEGSKEPLSLQLLSCPDYVREIVERMFQFEMKENGQNGRGYNARNHPVPEDETIEFFHSIMKKAMFGPKAGKYEPFYEALINTGRAPGKLHNQQKKALRDLGVISKVRRGNYEISGQLKTLLDRLNPA